DKKPKGWQNIQDVLSHSLNTGAAFVESKLGNENFKKYMLAFGVGEETGIDLPNETPGMIGNLNSPRDLEYAQASFGQGIAMSPIMIGRAIGAIANGGILVTPHVVSKINYKVGLSKEITYENEKRVIKKETADEVTRLMVHAVDTSLLSGAEKLPNFSVAAKTGTAQIAKEGGGGYYDDKFLHSFIGYFPAYNPKFLIFLFTKEPKSVEFAQNTLAKPFFELTKFLINYYEIAPDR
ncbi:MAG: penicillin-binding transpeptidase domain-containing protein, partial [Candidatus Paceibacterota bacterium]